MATLRISHKVAAPVNRMRLVKAILIRSASTVPPPRRTSRFAADGPDAGLTLDHFLVRSKVVALYRSFIRNTRGLGDLRSRQETVSWVRAEFEQHKTERDLKKIKSLYSSGKRQLKQLSQSGMLVGDQGDRFRGTRKADG